MRLWLIKSLLITLAKSVNLQVTHSHQARWANRFLCLALAHASVVCEIPLLATLLLLSLLTRSWAQDTLLPAPFDGHLRVQGSFQVMMRRGCDSSPDFFTLLNAYLGLRYFLLVLMLSDGKKCYLWRDSCSDTQYRRLILLLRQGFRERNKSESDPG